MPPDPGAGPRLLLITAIVLTSPKWLAIILWAAGKLPGWNRQPRFLAALSSATWHDRADGADHHAEPCRLDPLDADGRRWRLASAGARPQRLCVERSRAPLPAAHDLRHGLLLVASFAISPSFMLQNLPMACVLLFAPLIARQISGVAPAAARCSWRLLATPEDLAQPDIVRRAEMLAARGTTEVRRFAPPRRSRPMQRMGLAVRRAMRRVRRANARPDARGIRQRAGRRARATAYLMRCLKLEFQPHQGSFSGKAEGRIPGIPVLEAKGPEQMFHRAANRDVPVCGTSLLTRELRRRDRRWEHCSLFATPYSRRAKRA